MDILGTILWPLKWLVELVLVSFHTIFTTFGLPAAAGITWVLAIVGLVLVVRSALIPLFVKQIKSQRKMMEIAPELRKVQEKYRGKRDQLSREAMSRETMALYKKHGTTPVSSCLPLLVQMPIFFALFSVLNDVAKHAVANTGGVGLLTPELTQEFYDARLFDVASMHINLTQAWGQPDGQVTVIILATLVVLMIASQFITQLQIISKNLSPEAKTGQAYQLQKIMLYVLPLGFIFSGIFFPLGVVIYWFISNLWTMGQQFLVIRNMPTPGSDAARMRDERLAKKGKAIDGKGKIVPIAKVEAEQKRLFEEAEKARAAAPKRQQPVGKQRAKKQTQNGQNRPAPAKAPQSPASGRSAAPRPSTARDGAAKPAATKKDVAAKDAVVKRDTVKGPDRVRPVDGTSPA